MTTKLHITLANGKWLVNGNPYAEMTLTEREFFHRSLDEVRPQSAMAEIKNVIGKFVGIININDEIFNKPLNEVEHVY